jgi:hypothetical protein
MGYFAHPLAADRLQGEKFSLAPFRRRPLPEKAASQSLDKKSGKFPKSS